VVDTGYIVLIKEMVLNIKFLFSYNPSDIIMKVAREFFITIYYDNYLSVSKIIPANKIEKADEYQARK